jgi:hypothetical protein
MRSERSRSWLNSNPNQAKYNRWSHFWRHKTQHSITPTTLRLKGWSFPQDLINNHQNQTSSSKTNQPRLRSRCKFIPWGTVMTIIIRISLSSLLAISITSVSLYMYAPPPLVPTWTDGVFSLGCIGILLCSISHRYLTFRGHLKRRELLLERISVLYERILAIEAANETKKLWNGGMDKETQKRAIHEISRLKMAEAAWSHTSHTTDYVHWNIISSWDSCRWRLCIYYGDRDRLGRHLQELILLMFVQRCLFVLWIEDTLDCKVWIWV